jgi:hypothetical protein
MSKPYETLFKHISLKRKRVSALPRQPSADELRDAWREAREAEAAWVVACDTRACAGEKQDTAASNLENFWERVKDKRRIPESQEANGDRLVARYEAAEAAFEMAKEALGAATVARWTKPRRSLTTCTKLSSLVTTPKRSRRWQMFELLKMARDACRYLTTLAQRRGAYLLALARETEEVLAELKRKRKR